MSAPAPSPPARDGGGPVPWADRGAAAHWPAVRTWDFDRLAEVVPELPVTLVVGERERGRTRVRTTYLAAYLRALGTHEDSVRGLYLKEFDLLRAAPALRDDLCPQELFPRGAVTSSSAWIGPTGARTGLHYDLLDNVAVQLVGRKRFRLLPPGSVQRVGALSPRYDKWARLSRLTAEEVTQQEAHRAAGGPGVLTVDLDPGDVLHVPAGWWHEVENLSPGVLLSGFHGVQPTVGLLWMRESARHAAHLVRMVGRNGCTCHSDAETAHRPERHPTDRHEQP
ncbi:cupin-like domain-containing protein [Streptomyces sp. NPDC049687]|uniref:cupin-like domain-containing protein n=1 Tax=Streptomyces sp. NPDC049687 TaxID=3365596 RepID=UPI0037952C7B